MKASIKIMGLVLSSALLVACSQDLRDLKMSEITQAQKEEVLKNMKPDDLKYVKAYELAKDMAPFDKKMTAEEKKELKVDRSYNEIITFVKSKLD